MIVVATTDPFCVALTITPAIAVPVPLRTIPATLGSAAIAGVPTRQRTAATSPASNFLIRQGYYSKVRTDQYELSLKCHF